MDLTFEDFLIFILQFVILYFFTKIFVNGILILMEGKRQARLEEIARFDEITHRVKVEKHNNMYYWFDEDDGEFLGQGADTESIINVVKTRFPTHVFFITTGQDIYKLHAPSWTVDPLQLKTFG